MHTRKDPLPLYLLGLSAPYEVDRRRVFELLEWTHQLTLEVADLPGHAPLPL